LHKPLAPIMFARYATPVSMRPRFHNKELQVFDNWRARFQNPAISLFLKYHFFAYCGAFLTATSAYELDSVKNPVVCHGISVWNFVSNSKTRSLLQPALTDQNSVTPPALINDSHNCGRGLW